MPPFFDDGICEIPFVTRADAQADSLPFLIPSIVGERLSNVTKELLDLGLFCLPPDIPPPLLLLCGGLVREEHGDIRDTWLVNLSDADNEEVDERKEYGNDEDCICC